MSTALGEVHTTSFSKLVGGIFLLFCKKDGVFFRGGAIVNSCLSSGVELVFL